MKNPTILRPVTATATCPYPRCEAIHGHAIPGTAHSLTLLDNGDVVLTVAWAQPEPGRQAHGTARLYSPANGLDAVALVHDFAPIEVKAAARILTSDGMTSDLGQALGRATQLLDQLAHDFPAPTF